MDADLYFGPNLNYQFAKTVAATLYVEFEPVHKVGDPTFSWNLAAPFDISPGISWDITSNLNINPAILFYPSAPTIAATGTVMYISAKFL